MVVAHCDHRIVVALRQQVALKDADFSAAAQRVLPEATRQLDEWSKRLDAESFGSCSQHWSGESGGLEAVCRKLKDGWISAYETLYRATSGYAHGADLLRHVRYDPNAPEPGPFALLLLPGDNEIERTARGASNVLSALAGAVNRKFQLGFDSGLRELRERLQKEAEALGVAKMRDD